MKKTITILLAVLLLTAMLSFGAMAEDTVTQTTDENGNPVTIITDEEGNETIISQVEPGADDITFDEDDLDLEDEPGEAGTDAAAAEANADAAANAQKGPSWVLPAAIVGLVAVVAALAAVVRKTKTK